LQDQKLLATLSAGDVVAQELKYHGACIPSLHNKERAHLRMKQSMTEDADAEGEINQIVFADAWHQYSHRQKQVLVQHLFQKPVKPLVLCEMVLALGFLTAIYFSDGFC
jgi:hypothetical protein